MPFYAVAWGKNKGVFEEYNKVKESIDGFPQPVYKKFDTKKEAEDYLKQRKPEKEPSLDVSKDKDKYYTVARGKTVGIFTDYNDVKEYIKDYPQPLYKKHESYDEALSYFQKYNKGIDGDSTKDKKSDKSKSPEKKSSDKKADSKKAEKRSLDSSKSEEKSFKKAKKAE